MAILGFTTDLKEQLIFYGDYHSNPLNQAVHFAFVPLILWTVAVWLAYTRPLWHWTLPTSSLPPALAATFIPNWSFVLLAVYAVYYLVLEPFAGATWAAAVAAPMWAAANAVHAAAPATAWIWALGLHVVSWVVQVYLGHIVFEGRRPALLDSFFQSLVLAPLFVWFEFLFAVGYRPALRDAVQRACAANIAAWKTGTAGGGSKEAKKLK